MINTSRIRKILWILPVIYLIFRVKNVFLVTPFFDDYDSPAYFKFELFPSFRTHGITIIYSLIRDQFQITLFQAFIGSLSWIFLWKQLINSIENFLVKTLSSILFFSLGASTVIVEHDSALLSESLSISSMVILVGAAIKFLRKTNKLNLILLGLAMVFFFSTKATNSLIAPLIIIPIIILKNKEYSKIFKLSFNSVLIISAIFFFLNVNSSKVTESLTTSGTINNRLTIKDEWKKDLLESGYPARAFQIFKNYNAKNLGKPADQAVVDLPEFKQWWQKSGQSYLIEFTISNPIYAFIGPVALPLIDDKFTYRQTLLSGWSQGTHLSLDFKGFSKSKFSRTVFWPDAPEKAYLALGLFFLIIGISLIYLTIYDLKLIPDFAIICIFYIFIWSYLNWWFGSKPSDMNRHNLLAGVMIRILVIVLATRVLDVILKVRKIVLK